MNPSDSQIYACLDARSLQLILMPTEACNFRCTYCYEDFNHNQMRPELVRGVLNLLSRRATDLRALQITWFGGEPLLAFDIIEAVMSHAAHLRSVHPDLRVLSDITTNAYRLSRSCFERTLALGIAQYQISFDGAADAHDKKRVLAGGQGTFDRLWANLLAMRDVEGDFEAIVRLHVATDNVVSVGEFTDQFQAQFGADRRFKLYYRPLGRMGGANDKNLPAFEHEDGLRVSEALAKQAKQLSISHITNDDIAPICYAARGNSFVVRADGRINKCTVALEHPQNQVGRLLESGEIELNTEKMRGWMRGLQSRDPVELECPMRGQFG